MNASNFRERLRKFLPPYAVVALSLLVISNLVAYYGARMLNAWLGRPYLNMTGAIDGIIPVIPAFSIIYVIAFPFWYITYFLICRSDRERCWRLVITDVAAKTLCGVIFILLPTTNVRPEITGTGIGDTILGFIYESDVPDNLFPSIHCLESWICFLAIRDEEKVHVWIKTSAFILAFLICLSTVFTKQHVFVDLIAGVFIADFSWNLGTPEFVRALRLGRRLGRF